MKELIRIENLDGQLVVTSRQVSEDFGKRHSDVIEKIEELIKTENSVMTMFIESSYKAGTGKNYKEYLITKDGFSLLVMGFTGAKALEWKLKYINAFNKMEEALKNPYKNLSPEVQAIFALDQKQQEVEKRVHKLENTMTIDYSQQEEIRNRGTKRALELLGGKDAPAYKELSKKVFAKMWNEYKEVFNVNSYKNTSVKNYNRAIAYVCNWELSRELELMVRGANSERLI
ncbi:MAG: Rha family transcriptional regulator [Clostridium sp.]